MPHITSDESSCYYHGYVFAEMAVHQSRAHFHGKYGVIVDNPKIGPEMLESFWLQGSGEPGFLKMVEDLTGKPPDPRRLGRRAVQAHRGRGEG